MGLSPERLVGPDLIDIYRKVDSGERLSPEDGLRLYQTPNLSAVGAMANIVRERLDDPARGPMPAQPAFWSRVLLLQITL